MTTMTVIERALQRLAEEERQYDLGAENTRDICYWSAYLDGARAQKREDNLAERWQNVCAEYWKRKDCDAE